MKRLLPLVFLLAGASLVAAEASTSAVSLTVSAARQRPDDPWIDYPTRVLGSLPGYTARPAPLLTTYGGLADGRQRTTGFFRTQKIDGRWWLIDPAGGRFVHRGVVDVHIPKGSVTVNENLRTKFGTLSGWADATSALLREHGFNGSGAWSDDDVLRAAAQRLVYTPIWNFMSEYGKQRGGIYQQAGHMGYPKDCIFVFDPQFVAFCDEYAKRLAPTKEDPWLLGHYSDNELPFYRRSLDNFLKLPTEDPGRQAADQWLAEWRRAHAEEKELTDEARAEFLGYVTDRYLAITTAAIRKYDPNHLCLGPRFTGQALGVEKLFKACGRHLDVIALNYYHAWSPDPEQMKHWAEWSGRPFLITEWYAKGMDSGYANRSGAGWVVKTQADRGRFYQNFTLGLLESGDCVGWHWFKYLDNDPSDQTTDPSNRDSNKGLLNLKFEPYGPLAEAMKELNQQTYGLIDYFDSRRR